MHTLKAFVCWESATELISGIFKLVFDFGTSHTNSGVAGTEIKIEVN